MGEAEKTPALTSHMSDDDYERLTQNVHRSIMKNQGVTNIEVLHNVKIEGKSGHHHQIDVYWKFSVGNMEYQTAIECRKYKSKITVSGVKAFKATLDDIGNINGIMVTTNGYQKGAVLFAQQYDIKLSVLRSVNDADLDGTIQVIVVNISALSRNITKVSINVDRSRLLDQQLAALGDKKYLMISKDNLDGIRDSAGEIILTWKEISNQIDKDAQDVRFGEPANLSITDAGMHVLVPELGLIPLESVVITYVTNMTQMHIRSENPQPPHYLMETINVDGEIMHIHDDGASLHLK